MDKFEPVLLAVTQLLQSMSGSKPAVTSMRHIHMPA
jgi:hypothetical protein